MKESSKILLYGLLASVLLILLCLYTHQDEFIDRDKDVISEPLVTIEKEDTEHNIASVVAKKVEPLVNVPINQPTVEKESEKILLTQKRDDDVKENPDLAVRGEFKDKENIQLKEHSPVKKEEKKPEVADKNLPIEDNKPLIDNEKSAEKKESKKRAKKAKSKAKNKEPSRASVASIQEKISKLTNRSISFRKSKSEITAKGKKRLNSVIKLLKEVPNAKIIVKGYTDASGKERINLWISQERAKSVKRYLGKHGIPLKNIVAKGYGESELLYGDKPYSKLNRRVEIEIKKGK
jgi:outer membrane protein OmpA-like peptidoglycan-associated protein